MTTKLVVTFVRRALLNANSTSVRQITVRRPNNLNIFSSISAANWYYACFNTRLKAFVVQK